MSDDTPRLPEVVVTPAHLLKPMDEDQTLDYTQQQRQWVINKLTKNGTSLPEDTKETTQVLAALDGMDRNAIGRKRVKIDEAANRTMGNMTGIVAEMLRQSRNVTFYQPEGTVPGATRVAPELGSDVPEPELVEGELAQSPMQMSFETFQSQFQPAKADPNETVSPATDL